MAHELGRQMDVLDLVSFAQRNETLRRIAAASSSDLPANAHDTIAGVGTDEGASTAGFCADAPKG